MKTLLVDENNNLVLDSRNSLILADKSDAVAQRVNQRLMSFEDEQFITLFQGRWFPVGDIGVPWMSDILGRSPNDLLVKATLNRVIRETPGVVAVNGAFLSESSSPRTLQVNYSILDEFGAVFEHAKLVQVKQ